MNHILGNLRTFSSRIDGLANRRVQKQTVKVLPNSFAELLDMFESKNEFRETEDFDKHFKHSAERVKLFCSEINRHNMNWRKFSDK